MGKKKILSEKEIENIINEGKKRPTRDRLKLPRKITREKIKATGDEFLDSVYDKVVKNSDPTFFDNSLNVSDFLEASVNPFFEELKGLDINKIENVDLTLIKEKLIRTKEILEILFKVEEKMKDIRTVSFFGEVRIRLSDVDEYLKKFE